MVAPVVFSTGWFCRNMHGGLYAVSFETASRDTQTLNLSRNVSKFYARQVVSKICCLKSTRSLLFGTTRVSLKVKNSVETVIAKVTVFVSNISSPPLKRRYERSTWVFVFFFVIHVGALHVFNKNLKVYLYM